ncbi:hypothetical protein [Streptomyces sirii]|uniref:hypothetical protein n=1 Tax=Streptomyces sirii TaxID=3127701 RepID=UPI003D3673EB
MVRLKPFEDYNGIIGAACAWEYMDQSGEPISPPTGAMAQLVKEIRSEHADLLAVARQLRGWKAE